MSMLLRGSEELEREIREAASRHGVPVNTWLVETVQERIDREKADLAGVLANLKADPRVRELLDRLAQ